MKISPIRLNNFSKTSFLNTNVSAPILKSSFDSVSFKAKSQEEIDNKAKAKDLSKKAYKNFMFAKSKTREAEAHQKEAKDVLTTAKGIQKTSKNLYAGLSELFNYAKENGIKAMADYDDNSEIIFKKSGLGQTTLEKYKDGKLVLLVNKNDKKTIVFDYSSKKPTRSIFNNKNGNLTRYDGNFKDSNQASSPAFSDVTFTFNNGKLTRASYGNTMHRGTTYSNKIYGFDNGLFDEYLVKSVEKDGNRAYDEGFYFLDNNLFKYYKNFSANQGIYSADVECRYDDNELTYAENSATSINFVSAENVFIFKNSKIRQIAREYFSDFQVNNVAKLYTYSEKEIPQSCNIAYSSPYVIDFYLNQDDTESKSDKTLWL